MDTKSLSLICYRVTTYLPLAIALLPNALAVADDAFRVPFEITGDGAPVVVRAHINGHECRLFVDTGATHATFDLSMKEDLGEFLGFGLGKRSGGPVIGAKHRAPTIRFPDGDLTSAAFVACNQTGSTRNRLPGKHSREYSV